MLGTGSQKPVSQRSAALVQASSTQPFKPAEVFSQEKQNSLLWLGKRLLVFFSDRHQLGVFSMGCELRVALEVPAPHP